MSHNPLGRAYVIADMLRDTFDTAIIGPIFPDLGSGIWPPLRARSRVLLASFEGCDFPDYLNRVCTLLDQYSPDIVIVCKPRMPSLIIGLLFKIFKRSKLLLDIDDFEMSFFPNALPTDRAGPLGLSSFEPPKAISPHGELWTRSSQALVGHASAITVSNEALREVFGGTVVRHAKSELEFFPDPAVRAAARRQLGLGSRETAIMFFGTLHPHKGVDRLIALLSEMPSLSHVLVVVGTIKDAELRHKLMSLTRPRVKFLPDQPWDQISRIAQAADVVPLLQDESSPVSKYQFPAKMSEALAFGTPVLVTDVAPIRPFTAMSELITVNNNEDISRALHYARPLEQLPWSERNARQALFQAEFSYAANAPRLLKALDYAEQSSDEMGRDRLRNDITLLFECLGKGTLLEKMASKFGNV